MVRILIVEDNDIHRSLTEDFLSYRGYELYSLPNGNEFLAAIALFKPDLILLDLGLPFVNGFELLEQLRQSEWCGIPAVVVSACAFEREKQKAYQLGAACYLTKPISLTTLAQVIEANLSSGRPFLVSCQRAAIAPVC
jgi:two-component system, cell cycle response regulator DivK